MAARKPSERTIGSVIAHPLRSRCLARLAERTASPAELAIEFRKPLSDVSYHVATLLKAEAIELVGERPVRGSIQHFYRASSLPAEGGDDGAALAGKERIEFIRQAFQLAVADATKAISEGTLEARDGACFSRQTMVLDEVGWKELARLCEETAERIRAIGEDSAQRGGAGDGEEGIPVTAFLTFFERSPV